MKNRSRLVANRNRIAKVQKRSNLGKVAGVASITGFLLVMSQPASASFLSALKEWWATQNVTDSLNILTKQSVVSTHQVNDTILNSKQTAASALQAINTNLKMKDIAAERMLSTSTPSSAKCYEAAQKKAELIQLNETKESQLNLMSLRSANMWLTPIDIQTERLNTHKDLGCSFQEAALGYCTMQPTGLQYWDTDYSNVIATNAITPEQKMMANMRVVNMTLPEFDANATFCNKDQCSQEKVSYLSKSARSSLVANTMLNQISDRTLNKEFKLGVATN